LSTAILLRADEVIRISSRFAAIAHSRFWHKAADRIFTLDGRFRSGADIRGRRASAAEVEFDPNPDIGRIESRSAAISRRTPAAVIRAAVSSETPAVTCRH
jgi:hypothetical protein